MKPKTLIHKILLAVFLLALATWGTSCTPSTPQEPTQEQEPTQQQKTQQEPAQQQKTQQEPAQQEAAQTIPPTAQSSDLAARLIGTWEATSFQGISVPPGTQRITFLDDGVLQSTSSAANANFTAQYSVLDDSRIQITTLDGMSEVTNYSVDGDTLMLTLQGAPWTYQRTG